MSDVFISYKRSERGVVEHIATKLRGLGLSVWFDARMSAGETFNAEIDREARGAKAVLVCWSEEARDSRWVHAEAMIGFDRHALAAVYIGAADAFSPPTPFNLIHAEDLRSWLTSPSDSHAGWRSVLRRIGRLCGRADIESWGALDSQATAAELRAWIAQHQASPLLSAADEMLKLRDTLDERVAIEQAAKRAREEVPFDDDMPIKKDDQSRLSAFQERMMRQLRDKEDALREAAGREFKRMRRRWSEARDREERERARLESFIEANRLDREAYAKPVLQALALLIVAFLVDGVANATLFAGASEMGLIGGLVLALAVSAVNLAIGFATGLYGLRNLFHINNVWRTAGVIAIAIGAGSGLFFNLFIAHLRDIAEISIAAAQRGDVSGGFVSVERIDTVLVFGRLLADPLGLHTLLSYLLLASGLIVFIVGLKEGYDGFGDPYPGYGARYESWQRAKRRYEEIDQGVLRNQLR